jgi:hypothetical protein
MWGGGRAITRCAHRRWGWSWRGQRRCVSSGWWCNYNLIENGNVSLWLSTIDFDFYLCISWLSEIGFGYVSLDWARLVLVLKMETSGTLCMHAIDFGFYIYLLIMICNTCFFKQSASMHPHIFMHFTIYFYTEKYVTMISSWHHLSSSSRVISVDCKRWRAMVGWLLGCLATTASTASDGRAMVGRPLEHLVTTVATGTVHRHQCVTASGCAITARGGGAWWAWAITSLPFPGGSWMELAGSGSVGGAWGHQRRGLA